MQTIERYIFIMLFIIISCTSYSQLNDNFDFSPRGKVFAFFIIEDTYFSTGTLGFEVTYKDRHSIGFDYTFFGWQYQTDGERKDSTGYWEHDIPLYNEYERRGYFLMDYKYLFGSKNHTARLYINTYIKYGQYRQWYGDYYNEDFYPSKPEFLLNTTKGNFYELGIGPGLKSYFNDSKFGIDISTNYAHQESKNSVYQSNNNLEEKKIKFSRDYLYIRVNLFYTL